MMNHLFSTSVSNVLVTLMKWEFRIYIAYKRKDKKIVVTNAIHLYKTQGIMMADYKII